MAGRLLKVAVAVAAVVGVAILARPSDPQAPEPFQIERETPEASPPPTLPAFGEPSPEPEPAGDEATAAPGTARGPRAVVHAFDPRTLVPVAEPVELDYGSQGAVTTEASPGGQHLAVLHAPARQSDGAELRLYETGRLHEPPAFRMDGLEIGLPRFSPDGTSLVWLDFAPVTGMGLGGLRLGGAAPERLRDVDLPADFEFAGFRPLDAARVGVHGYDLAGVFEDGTAGAAWGEAGPVRLLVADLATGQLDVDVVLPTADGAQPAEGEREVQQERRAGVAWDSGRHRAYVAHADRDSVLVVDLGSGEVLAELAAVSPALVARGGVEARWREATLDGGGRLLYVHGSAIDLPMSSGDHQPGPGERELPVQVLDLDAGAVAQTVEARGRVLAASHGGEHVALVGNLLGGEDPHVLRLHDGRSLEPRWERPLGFPVEAAFLPGEGHLLVFSTDDRGGIGHPGNGWAVGGGRGRLDAVDLSDGEAIQTVRFQGEWWNVHLEAGIVVEMHYDH